MNTVCLYLSIVLFSLVLVPYENRTVQSPRDLANTFRCSCSTKQTGIKTETETARKNAVISFTSATGKRRTLQEGKLYCI